MKYILEYKSYYKLGDKVLIEYWYDSVGIVPVEIIEKKGNRYKVSYNVEGSKIKNAPDQIISGADIIDFYKTKPSFSIENFNSI
jgi:hypothetical protein